MDDASGVTELQESGHLPFEESGLLAPVHDPRWAVAAAGLAMLVFILELVAAPGIAAGVLHPLVVLFCLRAPQPRTALVAAGILSILTVVAALARPSTLAPGDIAARVGLILLATWVAAAFVYRFVVVTRERVERSLKALADTKYALDHAAILATTDTRGTIKSVNEKFCEISGYSARELIGQDHRIINSGYHPKTFIKDLWRTIAQGRIWKGEIRNKAKDGRIYWVDTTIVPFLDRRGKPYQYMAIRHDITERKQSEQRLREQEALARLGEMAAVVAHEVRNPLAGMRGVLQVIGARMPVDSRDRKIIGDVLARLDSLDAMVQDLLVFSRATAPKRRAISLHTTVQSTVDLLRRDPEVAGIEVELVGDDATVLADPQHLGTVLLNLLLNAAQAMNGEGRVTIEVRRTAVATELLVHDEGPGMPREVLARIFEPFFTTKHRGTGLGLPAARRLIEVNGGAITASCPPTGGTLVILSFSAAAAAAVPAASSAAD
jgi:PAS domain S-box-containing protein